MIHAEEIAQLAEFYDRHANALERLSPDRFLARRQFFARLTDPLTLTNLALPSIVFSETLTP